MGRPGFIKHHLGDDRNCSEKCRPLINEPPPIEREDNRGPNTKALQRRKLIHPGSDSLHQGT